jgi:hypothetical protein
VVPLLGELVVALALFPISGQMVQISFDPEVKDSASTPSEYQDHA